MELADISLEEFWTSDRMSVALDGAPTCGLDVCDPSEVATAFEGRSPTCALVKSGPLIDFIRRYQG